MANSLMCLLCKGSSRYLTCQSWVVEDNNSKQIMKDFHVWVKCKRDVTSRAIDLLFYSIKKINKRVRHK